ncbi:MAG: NADH-dependent [FeFe] hydrogenase, group A6 [Planctomycetota bacterium]|nr:NADH-dependent [FeFe] hydrogenase, group A6 [Planctomycetota bacterium]
MNQEQTNMVSLTMDDQVVSVPAGWTILQAAEEFGIRIPRLCYHPDLSLAGSCRVCIVDVKDMGHYMPACSTKVWPGMIVQTNSPEIRQARRDIVELLLDNHPKECQTCERDGNCELQNLAYTLGVRERLFEGQRKKLPADETGASVVREPNKCILCGRCVRVCAEVQGVCNLSQQGRGFTTAVTPAHGAKMDESVCIQCGQCINVCPTAAFIERDSTDDVWAALADPNKHVVIQTAPSIRAAIGEGFGCPPGTPSTSKMIASLRRLGFEDVFDTNFAADLTIVEESHEFLERLAGKGGPLPLLTSCSPGWISFLEKFYPSLIPNASSCRSPMSMMSALLKTYYARKIGRDPKDIYVVAVMPCVAKKFEAARPEHTLEGRPLTDAVLTTREAIWMIRSYGIDYWGLPDLEFWNLPSDVFDSPMGTSTGAADIFGTTGGVMEATLRTAVEKVTGKTGQQLEFTEVRAVEGLREVTLRVNGTELRIAVANGLANARAVLDKVVSGKEAYHAIEVMACPGGCIGGGGQPYPPRGTKVLDPELLARRASALYAIDKDKERRRSHENPDIKALYADMLGAPGSQVAHELLHTKYAPRLPRGILLRGEQ